MGPGHAGDSAGGAGLIPGHCWCSQLCFTVSSSAWAIILPSPTIKYFRNYVNNSGEELGAACRRCLGRTQWTHSQGPSPSPSPSGAMPCGARAALNTELSPQKHTGRASIWQDTPISPQTRPPTAPMVTSPATSAVRNPKGWNGCILGTPSPEALPQPCRNGTGIKI